MRHTAVLLGTMLVTFSGCIEPEPGPAVSEGSGTFHAVWTGDSVSQKLEVPVAGIRCLDSRLVEISGLRDETGAGLALWYGDSLGADSFPVFDPGRLDPPRPGAGAAVRWFEASRTRAYEGATGWVVLDTLAGGATGDTVSGRFDVTVRAFGGTGDTLHLAGWFRRVPLAAYPVCPVRRQ